MGQKWDAPSRRGASGIGRKFRRKLGRLQPMIRRRQIARQRKEPRARSALAGAAIPVRDAAWAVEERVVWGSADALRAIADVVKWPFERAVWAIERGLLWPLEERTGRWSEPLRATGAIALALLAVGAGVFGLIWASGSGGG